MARKTEQPYHHGDLRNALISAAISLIREKGPNSFSLREVAKKAGVSHAAPYRHFRDRSDLLATIAQSGFQLLAARLAEVASDYPEDPKRQLLEAGVTYVELAVENPEITQVMFGGYIEPENWFEALEIASEEAYQWLVRIIENGMNAGIYRKDDIQNLALTTWSLVHGLAMLFTNGKLQKDANSQIEPRDLCLLVESRLMEGILT